MAVGVVLHPNKRAGFAPFEGRIVGRRAIWSRLLTTTAPGGFRVHEKGDNETVKTYESKTLDINYR